MPSYELINSAVPAKATIAPIHDPMPGRSRVVIHSNGNIMIGVVADRRHHVTLSTV